MLTCAVFDLLTASNFCVVLSSVKGIICYFLLTVFILFVLGLGCLFGVYKNYTHVYV